MFSQRFLEMQLQRSLYFYAFETLERASADSGFRINLHAFAAL